MKITKKSIAIIIIIIAASALIIAAVIFIPKIVNRKSPEQIASEQAFNATVIKCNTGKVLDDADMKEIEELVKSAAGEKFKAVGKENGFAPMLNLEIRGYDLESMSDEEINQTIRDMVGERLVVTCLTLTEDECADVYLAIANHFEFDKEYGADINYLDISEIFKHSLNE